MSQLRPPLGSRRWGSLRDRFRRWRNAMAYTDTALIWILGLFVVAVVVVGCIWPQFVPYDAILVPVLIASIVLGPRSMPWFTIGAMAGVVTMVVVTPPDQTRGFVRLVTTFVICYILLHAALRRSRLGIAGPRGEAMLVDLRDRLISQADIGKLPPEWYAKSVLRSAGGTLFAGDFIVADLHRERLKVLIVDVSGKGVVAGTRSLMLSGAFGGLLMGLPSEEVLPAANRYLLRQAWDEGFATAVFLDLDLLTGEFAIRKAGHVPPVWMHAGSGTWTVLRSEGPLLGIFSGPEFEELRGRLEPGDGLMLYTDGLIEEPGRDIDSGIDRLAGRGEQLLAHGFEDGEHKLIDELERDDDDRAVLLVHRRPVASPVTSPTSSSSPTGRFSPLKSR